MNQPNFWDTCVQVQGHFYLLVVGNTAIGNFNQPVNVWQRGMTSPIEIIPPADDGNIRLGFRIAQSDGVLGAALGLAAKGTDQQIGDAFYGCRVTVTDGRPDHNVAANQFEPDIGLKNASGNHAVVLVNAEPVANQLTRSHRHLVMS